MGQNEEGPNGMGKFIWIWSVRYGDAIFARDRKKFMETLCPTRGPWFGKFMRGSKLQTGLINNQDFGVTSNMVKDMLMGWDTEWKMEGMISKGEISCLLSAVVIWFCGGFMGEELFIASLKLMLKFLEETRLKREQSHIMVTLKKLFKEETGGKWNMLSLVDITD